MKNLLIDKNSLLILSKAVRSKNKEIVRKQGIKDREDLYLKKLLKNFVTFLDYI